jgi:hypothetical protein
MIARRLGDLAIIQVQDASLFNEYVPRYRHSAVTFPGNAHPIKLNTD